jgi:hypothetical protein
VDKGCENDCFPPPRAGDKNSLIPPPHSQAFRMCTRKITFTQNTLFYHTVSANLSNSTTTDAHFQSVVLISGKQTTWSMTFPFQAHNILNDVKSNFTFLIARTSTAGQEVCTCSTGIRTLMYAEMQRSSYEVVIWAVSSKHKLTWKLRSSGLLHSK